MKTLVLVLCSFLLFNLALSANPFIGQWNAKIYGSPYIIPLSISNDTIIFDDGDSRNYTYDEKIITILQPDGTESVRLYRVRDENTIIWIYFENADGKIAPILVVLVRQKVPPASPGVWKS